MGATRHLTKRNREKALQILQEHKGYPVHNLPGLLGTDPSTCTKHIISWLRAQGHDIVSLSAGYLLQDISTPDALIVRQLNKMETMLAELMNRVPTAVPGKPVTGYRIDTGNGRPRAVTPVDPTPLIEAIKAAYLAGQPFTKTGARGVYARRDQLPEDFRIGRNRIEGFVADLLRVGQIIQDETGMLTIPDK